VGRVKGAAALASLAAICAVGPAIASAQPHRVRAAAFHPRIGGAMGIVPPIGSQDQAVGQLEPVVFHGGSVMRDVTIHTIFWAPAGYAFGGPPSPGGHGYVQLIQQFFTDVAHDSSSTTNAFSVLPQFGDGSGAGTYAISYNATPDSISDTTPYPPQSRQCASPSGIATCVTDLEVQQEIDRVIRTTDPHGRGLHDLWFVFLPANVDECDAPGSCGTNSFAGYHSLSNLGSGPTIYAIAIDPSIEANPPQGNDPQGNPDAESAIDTAAHETVEAMTDPEGTGWMDPNGNEIGDKCQTETGAPLGYAPDGSPYNQLLGGNQYLFQMMWANAPLGCVQLASQTASLTLPATVSLRQFSPAVSGNIGTHIAGVSVKVLLLRAGLPVAIARTTTSASGDWRMTLRSIFSRAVEAVGDDRDVILIRYGKNGPPPDAIITGSSGNPYTLSGFTGWFDLDNGFQVNPSSIQISPCVQTGVPALTIGGVSTASPIDTCDGNSDVATVTTPKLDIRTPILMTSTDNRAPVPPNPGGALVQLTIALGEPGSVAAINNQSVPFPGGGFPLCVTDLRTQTASCSGLVPGARYVLVRRRRHALVNARAGFDGVARFPGFRGSPSIRGGDLLTLRNRVGRELTALHVAHLRVALTGAQTVVTGGVCQPLQYWGAPVSSPPITPKVGSGGVAGTGTLCPPRGRAAGLPAKDIAQTDDLSGGQTRTELPDLLSTTPVNGAVLYGSFVALAQAGFQAPGGGVDTAGTPVALTITRLGSSRPVFSSSNVNTFGGAPITGLAIGTYLAKWVVTDANGDTRTVRTRLVEQR
jgi:hypothetical protein